MAGTIVADTIQDGAGNSTAMDNAIYGSAKAWVNFNGVTTATIRGSFNISSVTRTGTGQYTINFTTSMVDANYSLVGTTTNDSRTLSINSQATSNCTVRTTNASSALEDESIVCLAIFR